MGVLDRIRHPFGLAEGAGKPDLQEQGDTGMGFWGFTEPGTARRIRDLEYLHDLQGQRAFPIYDRMRLSDPKVDGLLSVRKLPLMKAEWRIESSDPKSDAANKVADFVRENLFERMAYPWHSVLWETMLHSDYGFAPFEIVWAEPDGKNYRVDRLALRPPSTIWWIWGANGRIEKVEQSVFGHWLTIPGEKLMWFVNRREGENWRGHALLRPMHKPWYAKERLEVLEMILAERGGGIPVFKMGTSAQANKALRAKVDSMIRNFRVGETMGMRLPADVEFLLETPASSLSDIHEMKVYYDQQLSNVALAQVLDLGKTATGSRSLGLTLGDMLIDACEAEANGIEDTFNAREGLIWQMVTYNFGEDPNVMPKLRAGKLGKVDALSFGQGLNNMAQAGLRFDDKLTVSYLRDLLGLPAVEDEAIDEQANDSANQTITTPVPTSAVPMLPAAAGGQTLKQQSIAAGQAVGEVKADVSKPSTPLLPQQVRIKGAEGSYWREPRGPEMFADLAELGTALDDGKTAVRTATQGVREKMVRELVTRGREAQAQGRMDSFLAGRPPMVDALQAKVEGVLSGFYGKGRSTVADELARQHADKPVVAQQLEQREQGAIAAAEPFKPLASLGAVVQVVRDHAQAMARSLADVAKHAVTAQLLRAQGGPVPDETVIEMAMRDSDAAVLRTAGTVTQLFSEGRADEAAAQAQDIRDGVYSALLDAATCDACEPMDGETTTDLDEAASWTPNPDCEGGDRCRCLVFYEISQDQGA